jgi:hypothetical protein
MFHFIQDCQFSWELDFIERNPARQMCLLQRIEAECATLTIQGARGHNVARIVWRQELLTWFHSDGTVVYLLSLRFSNFHEEA